MVTCLGDDTGVNDSGIEVSLICSLMLRSKGLKVRCARVVLQRKWSQGTGTLSDVSSALESFFRMNVLE